MVILLALIHVAFANYGHRGCQDSTADFKKLPENSMLALSECLQGEVQLQDHPKFEYLEFDVQETYDGRLVVFHDDKLGRTISSRENKEVVKYIEANAAIKKRLGKKVKFSSLRVQDLTLEELQLFKLKGLGQERVPELSEYLALAKYLGLRKPLVLEMKHVRSDAAIAEMLDLMQDFYYEYLAYVDVTIVPKFDFPGIVTFMSFKKNIQRSFGKIGSERHTYWCEQVRGLGLHGVYRPIFHGKDYCKAN